MNKFIFVCLAAVFCSCGGRDYAISGRLDLLPGDSVYLLDAYQDDAVLNGGAVGADTTFVLKGSVEAVSLGRLVDAEGDVLVRSLFVGPGDIRIDLSGACYPVSGTPFNDSLRRLDSVQRVLRAQYYKMGPETPTEVITAHLAHLNQLPLDMVRANTDNLLGVYLFGTYEFTGLADTLCMASTKGRLAEFPSALQEHPILRQVSQRLAAIEKTSIGSPYMELSLPDVCGNPVSLSGLVGAGRWVLLDFWASWCKPCVAEIPYLHDMYAAYRDKGLRIYAVSLDNDPQRWREFVAANDMTWINVLGVGADKQSAAAELYGIYSVPLNFLISPEGVIVAKNLRGKALEEKLKESVR